MSIRLIADHLAVAVCAAAKQCGADPLKAFTVIKGQGRECLAPAAGALASWGGQSEISVAALLKIAPTSAANAKRRNPRYWPAYYASFDALESRFGPGAPELPPGGPNGRPRSKAPPKPVVAPPAPAPAPVPAAAPKMAAPGVLSHSATKEEREAFIRKAWLDDGLTLNQIVERVPGSTRGIISGFISRHIGVTRGDPAKRVVGGRSKASPGPEKRAVARPAARALNVIELKPVVRMPETAPPPPEEQAAYGLYWPPGPRAVDLVGIQSFCCRWPVGRETGVRQLFCGEVMATEDCVYCTVHDRASHSATSASAWDAKHLRKVPA